MKRTLTCLALGAIALPASNAAAAGFEVGDNTALANARGGTGVVSKTDPSAATFNPGRLPFSNGYQLKLDSSLVDLNLDFQRDPLQLPSSTREFEPVSNEGHPFPVPYFATSWDLGTENLTVAFSASGPHAYGRRCFTELVDGECIVDFDNAARNMVIGTNLLQIYFLASVGYAFEFDAGTLGVGLSAGPAWQNNSLTLVVDQIGTSVGSPYLEDPQSQAVFEAQNLMAWDFTGIIGAAWEGNNGFRLGASYRPPIIWNAEGTVDLDLPESVEAFGAELTDDALTLRVPQAGSLKTGVGYRVGEHPGDPDKPEFDVEMNLVWENWSILEAFETDPQGALAVAGQEQELNPVVQPKDYVDTYALRIGSTWAPAHYASIHLGGFIETAAQRKSVTNVDFVSWERYAGSLGATYHIGDKFDVTFSYTYVKSPDRTVTDGDVYSQIPLSRCTYPDYDQEPCENPGTPPGNPQNEGTWSNSFHIGALGLRLRL